MPEPTQNAAAASAVFGDRGPEWLAAVARRSSRRAFDGRPVPSTALDALDECCRSFRPYEDARVVLVRAPEVDVFTGILGAYGRVTGTPHLLVFIADERGSFADQHVGFAGEGVVLEATRLGIDTCWVGGFFKAAKVRRVVELAEGERVYAVSPLGYASRSVGAAERSMQSMAGSRKRKCVEELAPGIGCSWPEWAVTAVETARLAPSAANRQPWRFRLEDGGLVIAKDTSFETPKVTKRLDCGIAMLHAELGAMASGARGAWTDLDGADVARFDPRATS
jgi:nitroreductase